MQITRVLIVDDDPVFAELLVAPLLDEGVDVVCAFTAVDAQLKHSSKPFDAVVIDLMLPPDYSREGIELLRWFTETSPATAVVMVTSREGGVIEIVSDALRAGATTFLDKGAEGIASKVLLAIRRFERRETLGVSECRPRVLYIGASPSNRSKLALDEEVRAISRSLRLSGASRQLEIHSAWAVRLSELQELLYEDRPLILHFGGHGSESGDLLLLDPEGRARPVTPRALELALTGRGIRLAVLNACFSDSQAVAIRRSVDFVITMSGAVEDAAAIAFSKGFYLGLAAGGSVASALDAGRAGIALEYPGDEVIPQLHHRPDMDPERVRLL